MSRSFEYLCGLVRDRLVFSDLESMEDVVRSFFSDECPRDLVLFGGCSVFCWDVLVKCVVASCRFFKYEDVGRFCCVNGGVFEGWVRQGGRDVEDELCSPYALLFLCLHRVWSFREGVLNGVSLSVAVDDRSIRGLELCYRLGGVLDDKPSSSVVVNNGVGDLGGSLDEVVRKLRKGGGDEEDGVV